MSEYIGIIPLEERLKVVQGKLADLAGSITEDKKSGDIVVDASNTLDFIKNDVLLVLSSLGENLPAISLANDGITFGKRTNVLFFGREIFIARVSGEEEPKVVYTVDDGDHGTILSEIISKESLQDTLKKRGKWPIKKLAKLNKKDIVSRVQTELDRVKR